MRAFALTGVMCATLGRAALHALAAQEPATEEPPAQEPVVQQSAAAEAARLRERVTFDVVRLFGVEGKTLVEVYSRVPTSALDFTERDGRWEASLSFELTVAKGDSVVLQDSWTRTKTVADQQMLDSSRLFFLETHAFMVGPGTYQLDGSIIDAAGNELGSLRRTIQAPEENPAVSDLLLAARIVADTSSAVAQGYDPTHKNRLVLNPNPGQVYSAGVSPLVYFYVEFDNVQADPLAVERVLRFREQGADEVVKEVRTPRTYRPGWSVDYGAVNVTGLPEGAYSLEVSWAPLEGRELPEAYRGLERRQEFMFVREPAQATGRRADETGPSSATGSGAAERGAPTDAARTETAAPGPAVDHYGGYTEAELDSVFKLLDALFERPDKSVFQGLTVEGKRDFLNRFWARNDPTPGTPTNEYYDEVDDRLDMVQSSFKGPTQQGYETPRGRIYLKYGKPDRQIERLLETGFSAPYEVWIYYSTGYKYVFLDEFRNRRYILLTSSDPEEQGRPDWQERLPPEAVAEILRE